jgi:DNA transformation protein and related proteins
MPVSPGYQTFVLDQLRRVVPAVRPRRMFGAVGLYAGELFFALIDDDVLYFKADDVTRPAYETRGLRPFQPFGESRTSMNYYQLPEDALEDPEILRPWADDAVAAARRARTKPKKGARTTSAKPKAKSKPRSKPRSKATPKSKTPPRSKTMAKSTTKPRARVEAKPASRRKRGGTSRG